MSKLKLNNVNMKKESFIDSEKDIFYKTDSQFLLNSNNNSFELTTELKTPVKTKFQTINSHSKIWSNNKLDCIKPRKSYNEKSKNLINTFNKENNKNKWFNDIILKVQKQFLPQLTKIQNDYIKELDQIYMENFRKIEEINDKYNNETLKNSNDDENNNEKNDLYEEVEAEFIIKKNSTLLKYNENISKLKENIKNEINKQGNNIKEELIISEFNNNNNNKKSKSLNLYKKSSCKNFRKSKNK